MQWPMTFSSMYCLWPRLAAKSFPVLHGAANFLVQQKVKQPQVPWHHKATYISVLRAPNRFQKVTEGTPAAPLRWELPLFPLNSVPILPVWYTPLHLCTSSSHVAVFILLLIVAPHKQFLFLWTSLPLTSVSSQRITEMEGTHDPRRSTTNKEGEDLEYL